MEPKDTIETIQIDAPTIKKPLSVSEAIILNAVIIGVAILIGSFVVAHGPFSFGANNESADTAQGALSPDIKKVTLANEPYIGSPTAPVVLAYWSDFQCPFCKKFETTTLQTLIKNYVTSGKVAIVFKDFAFLGDDSMIAAVYARAVWELYPNSYFAWRTALVDEQDEENSGFGDEVSIKKMTSTIEGVDVSKVSALVASKSDVYQKAIEADREDALKFGINGTPSFITGKTLTRGVVVYETFKEAFDAQLK